MTTSPTPEPAPTAPGAPAGSPRPTTGERLGWMARNSRRLIVAIVVLLVAAVVVAFSFSLFSSTSANPGNVTASGIMEMDNSADGQAILTAQDLLPGDSASGTVTVENVGDAGGDFTLSAGNLVDEPADPALSGVLTLTVTDGGTTVYSGLLNAFAGADLGTWAAGESHTYTFTVTFDSASGNEYQGARSSVDFTWDATQTTS